MFYRPLCARTYTFFFVLLFIAQVMAIKVIYFRRNGAVFAPVCAMNTNRTARPGSVCGRLIRLIPFRRNMIDTNAR